MIDKVVCMLLTAPSLAFVVPTTRRLGVIVRSTALDMNDPAVTDEFNKVKDMTVESVMYELRELNIPFNPTDGDVELKIMLVEARVRTEAAEPYNNGKTPAADASNFEKIIYEKPAIKKAWQALLDSGDINGANAFMEYINTPEAAQSRYGNVEIYKQIFARVDDLVKQPAFTSNKLAFDGFPGGMGEAAVRISLEEFGEVVSLTTKGADDVFAEATSGIVEFATKAAAAAAVDKWDGVDMGLGKSLSFNTVFRYLNNDEAICELCSLGAPPAS